MWAAGIASVATTPTAALSEPRLRMTRWAARFVPRLELDHPATSAEFGRRARGDYDWHVDDIRLITTDRGDAGQRLDLVLQRHLRDVSAASRTRIQSWIENGLVTVNRMPVTRP